MARPSARSEAQDAYNALPLEVKSAVIMFRHDNGRTWKAALRTLWMTAALDRHPDGAALKRVRNVIGPSGLDRVSL